MNSPRKPTVGRVPVLTQVLEIDEADMEPSRPMLEEALAPVVDTTGPGALAVAPGHEQDAVVARVMESLHERIDAIVERRVQAALEPIWRRLTEDLSAEVRTALALSLKETLRQAVEDELRSSGKGDAAANETTPGRTAADENV